MEPRSIDKAIHKATFDSRYEILSTIGRGSNSVVYKAILLDSLASRSPSGSGNIGETVALKVLTGNAKQPAQNILRMKREALALLSSKHPNVIRVIDYVSTGDLCYLSMEYAEHADLRAELEHAKGLVEVSTAIRWIAELVAGLSAVHRAGVIHRDIKPENILLTASGDIKLADFGIALLPTEMVSPDEALRGVGTFEYLAPEYLDQGVSSVATDLYSVAVTAFQLLTKELPFKGNTFSEQLSSKMGGKRKRISNFRRDLPRGLEQLIERGLNVDPAKRQLSADHFLLELWKVAKPYLKSIPHIAQHIEIVTPQLVVQAPTLRERLLRQLRDLKIKLRSFWSRKLAEVGSIHLPVLRYQLISCHSEEDKPKLKGDYSAKNSSDAQ